jgi:excisionase family DNA binding protein
METENIIEKPHRKTERSKSTVEPDFISPRDAARLTGTTRQTWTTWAAQGKLTSVKIGKRVLIPRSEFLRMLTEGTRMRRVEGAN